MWVLVDFDNIPELERSRGPAYLIRRIVDVLGNRVVGEASLGFRLYGGWFDGPNLSKRAQQLAPVVRQAFPTSISVTHNGQVTSLLLRVELALALAAAPTKYLTHTYRERASAKGVRSRQLPYNGCLTPGACPISAVHNMLRDGKCPDPSCAVAVDNVLWRPEQKLVDTMLALDAVQLGRTSKQTIVVVSADDDMWPPILLATLEGINVIHVHPLAGRQTPLHYASLAGSSYSQCSF